MKEVSKNIAHTLHYRIVCILFGMVLGTAHSLTATVNESYREAIDLHVGRTTYISGESVWYKAYASSNASEIFSQALYVELVNSSNKHVLGQILKIEKGSATAALPIPDTLGSGNYRLIAYTNWMRNFSPEYFASFPVLIFNQYDEDNNKTLKVPNGEHKIARTLTADIFTDEITSDKKIDIPIEKISEPGQTLVDASLSVFKLSPDLSFENGTATDSAEMNKPINTLRIFNSQTKAFSPEQPTLFEFPIEDIGILYSGQVVNQMNNSPISGINVRMALEDSLAVMLASATDPDGKFAFLIERTGSTIAYLELFMRDTKISGSYQINLDSKFHFHNKETVLAEADRTEAINIADYLQNEAERVVIQRAFDRLDTRVELQPSDSVKHWHFYGEAAIEVYPDIYFDLPNFEEISREILPRVKYNKGKQGCELAVMHIENGIRSDKPILLIDGIPAENYCVAYPLRSKDIDHIEVQSGMRISGNLEYNGLVALFTSREYKLTSGNQTSQTPFLVDGYQPGVKFERASKEGNTNSENYTPDFQNLLYWNPSLNSGETASFLTSDEDAIYIIDLMGVGPGGEKVHTQTEFSVNLN